MFAWIFTEYYQGFNKANDSLPAVTGIRKGTIETNQERQLYDVS
jgi:hypothetical protein